MPNSLETLLNFLERALAARGAKAHFCRATEIDRSLLEVWLARKSKPGLEQVDKIAGYFNKHGWEILKPDEALPTPVPVSPTVEALSKILRDQELRIKELESGEKSEDEFIRMYKELKGAAKRRIQKFIQVEYADLPKVIDKEKVKASDKKKEVS